MTKLPRVLLIFICGLIFVNGRIISKCPKAKMNMCDNSSTISPGSYTPKKTRKSNLVVNEGCEFFRCPHICVECLDDCPTAPDCPKPLQYCSNIEDTCKRPTNVILPETVDPCNEEKNPCKCLGDSLNLTLQLCPPVVDAEKCNDHCGYILNETMIDCVLTEVAAPNTPADAPIMLATYIIPSITILSFLCFTTYRNSLIDKFHKGKRATIVPDLEVMDKQYGFCEHPIGTAVFFLTIFSCFWFLWMVLVIILENYMVFPYLGLWDTTLGFFKNGQNMTEWFVLIWNLAFFLEFIHYF